MSDKKFPNAPRYMCPHCKRELDFLDRAVDFLRGTQRKIDGLISSRSRMAVSEMVQWKSIRYSVENTISFLKECSQKAEWDEEFQAFHKKD